MMAEDLIGAVRSISLGAKVGVTFAITLAACGVQTVGVIALWRRRYLSGGLIWLVGLAGLFGTLPLWW